MVDETSLPAGRLYEYETDLDIDNSSVRKPVIVLNITAIFKAIKVLFNSKVTGYGKYIQ